MEILNKIQKELKAPKSQHNSFGNYNYRSCEDILLAVKPLLGSATLILTDDITLVGDRYYVKATATIKDGVTIESSVAYARETLDKKGMDAAQITGAASSYARKYALNGLFCIDDTKDADSNINSEVSEKIDITQLNTLLDIIHNPPEGKKFNKGQYLKYLKVEKLEDLTKAEYSKALSAIQNIMKVGRP